jgi:hypothetical protein
MAGSTDTLRSEPKDGPYIADARRAPMLWSTRTFVPVTTDYAWNPDATLHSR